jgi:anti-sigma factor NepR-like protein
MGKRGEQEPAEEPTDKDTPSQGGSVAQKPFPVHEHVGRRLKEMFDEVTTQAIPEKFVKLLEELEQSQSLRQPPDGAEPGSPQSKRKPRKSK